jgi:hypothetical protein
VKQVYGGYGRWLQITRDSPRFFRYFRFYQAEKGGGLVLKDEAHWTKINGFELRVRSYNIAVVFRRFSR